MLTPFALAAEAVLQNPASPTAKLSLPELSSGASPPQSTVIVNYALRTTLGAQAEGDPSLGLGSSSKEESAFINLSPRLLVQLAPNWSGYTRLRAFLPTSRTRSFDSANPDSAEQRSSSGFAELSELWLQYGGLTSYPGEALRLGQQRIQQAGNEWWDEDIAALRWVVDTTTARADLGVARQLVNTRSDDIPIPSSQRDRNYAFLTLGQDWRAGQRINARLLHALDDGGAPAVGSGFDADSKLSKSRLTWLGLTADNGFYRRDPMDRSHYWVSIDGVHGKQTNSSGSNGVIARREGRNISGLAGTIALSFKPQRESLWDIGALYTLSSRQYEQSGVQSNASTFAGTRTQVHRYNEALRAELGNLQVFTAFATVGNDDDELTAVVSNFRRISGARPITTDGLSTATTTGSRDVGVGIDVVASHSFGRKGAPQRLLDSGDAFSPAQRRSLVGLRASAFEPGAAYGRGAKTDYRLLLEVTLWTD